MLENSFIHLPGISAARELKFWSEGVHTWEALDAHLPRLCGPTTAKKVALALQHSREALARRELAFFQKTLKSADMWRLLPLALNEHAGKIAYLDIETTGLGFPPQCRSTTVAVLFGGDLFLEHDPERKRALMQKIDREAEVLITFNGSTFDLPFLRREFAVGMQQVHVDLRFWLARLGFRGGLKKIQMDLPEVPQRDSMDIDGFDAVRLWKLHQRGVPRALETLLAYNAEDTIVLEALVYVALNFEAERRPHLGLAQYDLPPLRAIPFAVCPSVYKQLRFM